MSQITYDPAAVSYDDLLTVFWDLVDPTTLNRQGGDAGTQYRSGIYYHDEDQHQVAERYRYVNIDRTCVWPESCIFANENLFNLPVY